MIAKRMKKLPDDMKSKFMKNFYQKNIGNPNVDELCKIMKEKIGYSKDDYKE
jgi:hypothetical protein